MSHGKELFLDHAATTPVHPDVVGLMLPYFGNHFGITTSLSELGRTSRRAVEEARCRAAALIDAAPEEIIFSSGATESNNLAIIGAASSLSGRGKHIITSTGEHPSVINACRHLERRGFEISYVSPDAQGKIDPALIADALRNDTILISIMHASHETGVVQPVEEIGALARERGVLFHCNAAQSAGKIPVNTHTLPADLLSFSSHKLYGPKGVGALFVRKGTVIDPVLFGSGQEQGLRPGTVNVPCVAGFGLACVIALRDIENNGILITSLRESLEQQVISRIDGARIHGSGTVRLPHISSISFRGVRGDDLAAYLDAVNIVVSPGSAQSRAWHGQARRSAEVLPEKEGEEGTIRLSIGWENKEKDIRRTVDRLEEAVRRIREFAAASPDGDVTVFTFPDKSNAAAALKALKDEDMVFSPVLKPDELMQALCSNISLACLSRDQARIGSLLGAHGIEIAGMHTAHPMERPMKKKERDFWEKVEQIKKRNA
ncbi:MAG: Cysteine desulfurase [Deltaproteobacteria bacterium ADurb.BinA179]|jgi:cysteine desulfurase|nr:MAG: Cysteine desulfurase [Deltaproteobacteria bacterium ADurb.BinA179]HON60422.1 cysteine desulfurase family protein [Deltaproteobacteria bacterium]